MVPRVIFGYIVAQGSDGFAKNLVIKICAECSLHHRPLPELSSGLVFANLCSNMLCGEYGEPTRVFGKKEC